MCERITKKINAFQDNKKKSFCKRQNFFTHMWADDMRKELNELNDTVDDLHGIIKTDEELNLYIERIQVILIKCLTFYFFILLQ